MEDVWNKWRRNFLVLSKLKCSPQENHLLQGNHSLRKQPTFSDARNERTNALLLTRLYPDIDPGSASDWLKQISHSARPIKSTTQIWVVTGHQYEISACASFSDIISRGNQLVVEVVESWNVACFLRSREIRLHLAFSVNWNKSRTVFGKSAKSFLTTSTTTLFVPYINLDDTKKNYYINMERVQAVHNNHWGLKR